eukprot:3370079-Rhodomonas_salina.2
MLSSWSMMVLGAWVRGEPASDHASCFGQSRRSLLTPLNIVVPGTSGNSRAQGLVWGVRLEDREENDAALGSGGRVKGAGCVSDLAREGADGTGIEEERRPSFVFKCGWRLVQAATVASRRACCSSCSLWSSAAGRGRREAMRMSWSACLSCVSIDAVSSCIISSCRCSLHGAPAALLRLKLAATLAVVIDAICDAK